MLIWFQRTIEMLLMILMAVLGVGCTLNTEPIERTSNTMIHEVIKPAVAMATEETAVRAAQLQGSGQLINPGYEIETMGGLFNGWYGKFVIRVVGAAGQLQGAGQADQGPDLEKAVEPPLD